MPKCTLYLTDPDYVIYQDLKARNENPSAILAKALKQRSQKLDAKTAEMKEVQIFEGYESIIDEDVARLEIVRFVGKEIAVGEMDYDPAAHNGLHHVKQTLYLTRKLNYLVYEQISESGKIYHRKTIIEKGKPLPNKKFANEILKALGVQDEIGTFLDI